MHDDIRQLFEHLQGMAVDQLREQGGFSPSGALLDETGSLVGIRPHVRDELPTPERAVELLESGLRQDIARGDIRAAGYCVDVKVQAPGAEAPANALLISMERPGDEGFDVFVPYDREAEFALGRPFGNRRPTRLFPPSTDDAAG